MDNGDPRFPYPQFLRVPCVIVPEGSPPPLEWMAAHPHHFTIPGFCIPPPPAEADVALEPRPEAEGQADPPPEEPTFLVEIDYAGNFIARPVAPLTLRPAPWTEPPPAPLTEEAPAQWPSPPARAHANFGVSERSDGSPHLFPGVQTVAVEDEDEPGDDELDPFAEVRAQEFSEIQAQIAQLDPASPYAASISAPGWVPTQNDLYQIEGALDEKIDEIASEIASGHASGGATDYAFEAMINATIRNPSKSGTLRRGRSYYYDQPNNFVVIVDPNGADSGTAFHPATGSSYLKTLE